MTKQGLLTTRRSVLTMSAAAAASVTALGARAAAQSNNPMYKIISVLARKPDQTIEEFVKHWEEVHAPLVKNVPGVVRYTLSIVRGSSTRTDGVGPLELPADGFAELWFEDMASLQKAAASDAVKTVLKDGTLFVGREVDFVVEERVIIPNG
jgi:uncharacterized protein (TIGR02118 family)